MMNKSDLFRKIKFMAMFIASSSGMKVNKL